MKKLKYPTAFNYMTLKLSHFSKRLYRLLNKPIKRLIIVSLSLLLLATLVISVYHMFENINGISHEESLTGNFNSIILKMNDYYNPNIAYPYAEDFDEKDIRKQMLENSLGSYQNRCPTIGLDKDDVKNWHMTSNQYLSTECLVVNSDIKARLSEKHQELISTLLKNSDSTFAYPGKHFYEGDGIVFVGGGTYSLMTFSVIKTIRSLGTTLPIEVLIPTEEDSINDKEFCALIEEYNSKCIYLNRIFTKDLLEENEFQGFQYKSLALFASSFENVLLLDADDYPLKNLDSIFTHKVFKENGLILWPDFWKRTTNPFFYESANAAVNVGKRVRNGVDTVSNLATFLNNNEKADSIPFHDFDGTIPDPSSETGQMMLNKKKHWSTLLLSLYYNIYGPNVFYHLLSQYSSGQGDKETFIAAAHLLDLPYYQIFSSPSVDGYFTEERNFRGLTYYQKDFRADYEAKLKLESEVDTIQAIEDPVYVKETYFRGPLTEGNSLFAHCNLPKFDPLKMAVNSEFVKNNLHFRGYTHKTCLDGLDLEREINLAYKELLCGDLTTFNYMFHKAQKVVICNYIQERLDLFDREPLF